MVHLVAEEAWVEFPISVSRSTDTQSSQTGGTIDVQGGVVTALSEVSLDLREGDRLGLIGHNGAGKTTLLRLLSGAYSPTRGRVSVAGRISTLFNSTPGLSLDGTGRENIVTCGLYLGMSPKEIRQKTDEIIEFSELGPYIDLPVRIYSAGMVTRLGFSIATAVEPEILLLDEGLATGDVQFSQKAQQKMQDLMERSSILVIASHSEALLASICNRCVILDHGRILAEGPTKSLLNGYIKSSVDAAQYGDPEGLRQAYLKATEKKNNGEFLPPELEELGLRYALLQAPDDPSMLRRYVQVILDQGKEVAPELEIRMLLSIYSTDPFRTDLLERLAALLDQCSEEDLSSELRNRAIAVAQNHSAHSI